MVVWADSSKSIGRVWMARSINDGKQWSGDKILHDGGAAQRRPTIAVNTAGTIWVTYDHMDGTSYLISSIDNGQSFSAPSAITSPGGALKAPELCSGGDRAGLVGVTTGGDLYWVGL